MQIRQGHIYAFRVVDGADDFYLLMRVDELVRGKRATVSTRKIDKSSVSSRVSAP
jgi:hypothetical protein